MQLNQTLIGNCEEILHNIEDNSIDLIITDPPYGGVVNDKWDEKNGLNSNILEHYFRVLKSSGSLYIFCGIGEKSNSLLDNLLLLKDTKFIFKDLITWKKSKGNGNKKGWLYTREELIWCVKDNSKFIWNKENQYSDEKRNYKRKIGKSWFKRLTNVWTDINENLYENIHEDRVDGQWAKNLDKKYQKLHSTIKPIKIIDRIIKAHHSDNCVVLDTFAGSGTTGCACILNNCNYILIEKESEYESLIAERILDVKTNSIKRNKLF